MCLDTYLYLHCVSRKRYQNLVQHYQQNGLLSPNSWQHDGYVNVRHHSASEETQVNILKANADLTALKAPPQLTPIPGLDIQRQ